MKKLKPEAIHFVPIVQVHDTGAAWAISFDSGMDRDLTRAPRVVFVDKQHIKQLDVKFEGFEKLPRESDASLIEGRIVLVVEYFTSSFLDREKKFSSEYPLDSNVDVNNCSYRLDYPLADCKLRAWTQHIAQRADIERGAAADLADVQTAIRKGTATALSAALPDLFAAMTPADEGSRRRFAGIPSRGVTIMRGRHTRRAEGRLHRYGPWAAVVFAFVLVWMFMAHISRTGQPDQSASAPSPQESQALLQNLAQSQAISPQDQVALTKETLKSMGLDPGASGDTGCLVQQH